MKKVLLIQILFIVFISASTQWKPSGDKIKTIWGENFNPEDVLSEYPRPALVRNQWLSLNGLWDYSITAAENPNPKEFEGKIMVPFAVESSLSGVQRKVGKENILWYHRKFKVPVAWKGKDILLNFGAVDWKAEVWLNDIKIGSHTGGYTSFSFNISPYLNNQGDQTLVVKVWDPTDDSYQPRGKQVNDPKGIWYTPVTGIWQTVWLEPVNPLHIKNVYTNSDIDIKRATFHISSTASSNSDIIKVSVFEKDKLIATEMSAASEPLVVFIENPKLWHPDSPFLYDVELELISEGKTTDKVKSYFAMRKISSKRDSYGIIRLQLNNEDYFQLGPLDQGWWPDGLYTAPTDEALLYDIKKTKELGFNMIRKHVKVEPARWYSHCDRLGMLVWQDMPSGGMFPGWVSKEFFTGTEKDRSPESEANFRKEWKEIMDQFRFHPSIVCWVPFNESWGQFKTKEIVEWTKSYDPTRLINPASGGNHFQVGDMLDLHNYPEPKLYLYDASRANVLGEYGGIGFPMEGHLWNTENNWGYIKFRSSKEVTDTYVEYTLILKKLAKAGFSAGVYTQTTDVEGEVNGLLTYDRKVVKVDADRVRKANQELINSFSE